MMIVVIAATHLASESHSMNARSDSSNKIEFVYQLAGFGFLLAVGLRGP